MTKENVPLVLDPGKPGRQRFFTVIWHYNLGAMNAQHWRAIQLYFQRDVLRFVAAIAFVCLLIADPNPAMQAMAGVALIFALYHQYQAGAVAREIDAAAANLVFETDPIREAEARERLDSLVIRSRFDYRIWRKPIF